MTCIPPEPEVPTEQRASGPVDLRYEDVTQDGRVALTTLPYSLAVVWRDLGTRPLARELQDAGIVPVLTRLCLQGGSGTVSVLEPLEAEGRMQLAHTRSADGEIDRIVLLMWTRMTGRRGRMYGPPPHGAGETVEVGRVFAEHVFTRLFAPPDQRKVRELRSGGLPDVPPARYEWRAPAALLDLPPGARALDDEPALDDAVAAFGLDHSDSNQHVNSLVYPRQLIDAALRRLAAHDRGGLVLAREAEIAFRKPSFAGDRARWWLRAFVGDDGTVGATGALVPAADPNARPLVTGRLRFGS